MTDREQDAPDAGRTSRRTLLRLGALAAPAVVTLKPAFAQTQASILNCEVPVTTWVTENGEPALSDDPEAIAPPNRPYIGEEIRTRDMPSDIALVDSKPYDQRAFDAHIRYLEKHAQPGQGLTCMASIMRPR